MKANERINEIKFRPVKGTRYHLFKTFFLSPYEPYDIAHMIRIFVYESMSIL